MAVFVHTSISHSACGFGSSKSDIKFNTASSTTVSIDDESDVNFFAMDKLPLDSSEPRLLSSLENAVKKLIAHSEIELDALKHTALILSSTSLDIGTVEPKPEQSIWLPTIDRLSQHLQQKFGLHAFHLTVNTACTASINALLIGKNLIEKAAFRHVIVVGCEFYNELTLKGFHSLDLVANDDLKAFDNKRDGLILGEGIGAVLLSSDKPLRNYYYQLLEGQSSCDTTSLTMTSEDGSHIKMVLSEATRKSKLSLNDIDLIKVHGTATYNNDLAESNGINACFSKPPPIFALKPFIGHTLGACGAIELALMDHLLEAPGVPVGEYVEQTPHDIMMEFINKHNSLVDFEHVLINHSGFGGNNAALVLRLVSQ